MLVSHGSLSENGTAKRWPWTLDAARLTEAVVKKVSTTESTSHLALFLNEQLDLFISESEFAQLNDNSDRKQASTSKDYYSGCHPPTPVVR